MTPEELVTFYQAVVNGEVMQFKGENFNKWVSGSHDEIAGPNLSSNPEHYRIKLEPKKLWVNEYGEDSFGVNSSKAKAESNAGSSVKRKAVLYREVIE